MDLSPTQARVDLTQSDNGSLSNGFQFGKSTDPGWTLSGATFKAEFKAETDDVTPLLTLSSASGSIVIDDVVKRVVHFNLSPTALRAALKPGIYVYDLLMTDTYGVVTPLMGGFFTLSHGVTED